VLLLATSSNLYAQKTAVYTGSPVVVKVAYRNLTEVVFEGDELASIILGLPPEQISIQNTYNTLFIQPLADGISGDISVVMKDGRSKIITLVSVMPAMRDRSVKIVDGLRAAVSRVDSIRNAGITPAGLIKAMILGEDLDGVSISPTKQVIIEVPVRLVATTVYDAVFMRGYIVDMTDHPNFDIKQITMRGLIAGAVYNGKGYFVISGGN